MSMIVGQKPDFMIRGLAGVWSEVQNATKWHSQRYCKLKAYFILHVWFEFALK